jgi:hypothetical protein
VGIDVGAKVAKILHHAFGERMAPPESMARVIEDGRLGRKNKRGFYLYDEAGKKKGVDATVYALLPGGGERKPIEPREIQERLVFAFLNEAVLCLQEGILRSPRDGDIGAIFGLGFPPSSAGPSGISTTWARASRWKSWSGCARSTAIASLPRPSSSSVPGRARRSTELNLFTDNDDLQFHFREGVAWDRFVPLWEEGFRFEDGPRALGEARRLYTRRSRGRGSTRRARSTPRARDRRGRCRLRGTARSSSPPRWAAQYRRAEELGVMGGESCPATSAATSR